MMGLGNRIGLSRMNLFMIGWEKLTIFGLEDYVIALQNYLKLILLHFCITFIFIGHSNLKVRIEGHCSISIILV